MIRTLLEFSEFIFSVSPFLVSLLIWGALAITFSKKIKQHYKIIYWIFGVLGFAFAIPIILRFCGLSATFNVASIPVLGTVASELSSAAYFIHPVLVIVMYMGALSVKSPYVAKLMSIRKELSIIVGFPLLAHLAKRLLHTFPNAWSYFANYEESVANPRVVSELAANISNGVYILGAVMTILFLVLWVTSFDSVHRKLGNIRWKKIQRWSYALYAMLFIHAMGIQTSSLINYNVSQKIKQQTELIEKKESLKQADKQPNQEKVQGKESRPKPFSVASIELSRGCRATINIIIYILVYGSYLILRLRKSRLKKRKREMATA